MEAAATQTNAVKNTNTSPIPLALIQPSGYNPRRSFDEQSLTELADSIRQQGVLQPVGVRRIPDTDRYEIVYGERRYRASLMAGREDIPAIIYDALSDTEAEEMAATENLQREDVAPMEEAEAFRRLVESGRHDAQSLAVSVGKSVAYVRTRMKLTTLIPEIASLLDNDEITVGVASEICRYGGDIQKEVYDRHLKDGLPYNSWRGMSASKVARMIESDFTTELCRYSFDKSECSSCPHNTCNLLLFTEEGYSGKCANASCLREKHTAHLTEKALSMLAGHPGAAFCQYKYDTNEAVAARLADMGYDVEDVDGYPNRFPKEPAEPKRDRYDTEEDYAEALEIYSAGMQNYRERYAELLSCSEAGEITLCIWVGSKDVALGYKAVPVGQREDGKASAVRIAELEAKDSRNKEIAIERTIEDTKKQILNAGMTESKFTSEEDRMIYFFLLSSLRREHYEAVGLTGRDDTLPLTDEEKMSVIASLSPRSKAVIRRDFLIANFRDASRTNAISTLLFAFARKHMPEELAAIEGQYNEVYEKRHRRIEERIAQLKSAEQTESESGTPDTAAPDDAVAGDEGALHAPEEAEAVQTEQSEDMAPQEMNKEAEESAA